MPDLRVMRLSLSLLKDVHIRIGTEGLLVMSSMLMEGDKENPMIKVLIHLSSKFLCEALQVFLERDFSYWTVVAHSQDKVNGFAPHIVLVDAISLGKSIPGQWHEAKVLLIDTGLSGGEMTRLLTTYQLSGVISTGTGTELFKKALAAINAGQSWIDPPP